MSSTLVVSIGSLCSSMSIRTSFDFLETSLIMLCFVFSNSKWSNASFSSCEREVFVNIVY
jgi:hypothetical protein